MAARWPGLHYDRGFVAPAERELAWAWLASCHPLLERRYAGDPGADGRSLLRPVIWLGAWQFACLDYYRPPQRVRDVAVAAEPLAAPLEAWARRGEARARAVLRDLPRGWRLNTCLVNFYGDRFQDGRWVDVARVGDHRDFEPGPVASVSLGERAYFQFVRRGASRDVVHQQWLDDGSLQLFWGAWKDDLLHRVQRVDRKGGVGLPVNVEGFRTRRVNFTFRWVPEADIQSLSELGRDARVAVEPYVRELAAHSTFWASARAAAGDP